MNASATAGRGLRIAIVRARFNEPIGLAELETCVARLHELGVASEDIAAVDVPGALEIPIALQRLAATGRFDALIALGAVIRGGTPHFDYVATEVAKGVFQISLELDVPVAFGVLTCDTLEQALERSGAKGGNKGWEAAQAAVESADLRARLAARAAHLAPARVPAG